MKALTFKDRSWARVGPGPFRSRVGSALVGLVVALAGCGGAGTGATDRPGDGSALLGRTFLSTSITEGSATKQLVSGTRISISFPEKNKIAAQAGCNHLFGTVTFDTDKLGVSVMGGTDMGCAQDLMAQDQWLMSFLSAKPAWQLNGDELVLTGAQAEMKLTDRKVADPDRPLAGTPWTVDTLVEGQSAGSVPNGAAATLLFDGDKVTGNTGCNRLTGKAVASPGKITFSGIATTKMLCAEEVNKLEQAVLAVLDGEVAMKITAGRLELTHPGGKGLYLRATP